MIDSHTSQLQLPVLTETPPPLEMSRIIFNWIFDRATNHDQGVWGETNAECGTTLCIAGAACVTDPNTWVSWKQAALSSWVTVGGDSIPIEDRAAVLLGMDEDEAYELFYDADNEEARDLLSVHIAKLEAEAGQITCPECGKTSHNPNDVRERYCGHCHRHHDTMEAV